MLFQSRKKGSSVFSSHLSVCCGLKVMKTIFHLHGVISLGVAEQVCYGKINIMEGLTLFSLSHWDQCVYYWTGYITQTRRHAMRCAHTLRAKLFIQYANMHTHKEHISHKVKYACSSRDIHAYTHRQSISPSQHTIPHPPLCALVMSACMCVRTRVCACLPASHWML